MNRKLSKICFLVEMKEDQKTGLFNATYQRINDLTKHIVDYEIYSIINYDGKVLSWIKKFFNKDVLLKGKSEFTYNGLKVKCIYVKQSVLSKLLQNLGIYIPFFTIYKLKKSVSKYEMICAHWGYPQGYLSYILSKKVNIPYTVTYHGSDVHTLPFQNKNHRHKLNKTINNSHLNIFVSKNLMELSINKLENKSKNNVVISNQIDINTFYPISIEEKLKLKRQHNINEKVVGFVGNLLEIKRADRLPEIFDTVAKNYDESVKFFIIGNGPCANLIKDKCKSMNLNVQFFGKLEPSEINKIMNIMDILILPSLQEAFGLVVLEANACGTLALGSNVGGISEAIGNKDYLVENNEYFERNLGRKISYYLKNGYDKEKLRSRVHKEYAIKNNNSSEYKYLNDIYKANKKIN